MKKRHKVHFKFWYWTVYSSAAYIALVTPHPISVPFSRFLAKLRSTLPILKSEANVWHGKALNTRGVLVYETHDRSAKIVVILFFFGSNIYIFTFILVCVCFLWRNHQITSYERSCSSLIGLSKRAYRTFTNKPTRVSSVACVRCHSSSTEHPEILAGLKLSNNYHQTQQYVKCTWRASKPNTNVTNDLP